MEKFIFKKITKEKSLTLNFKITVIIFKYLLYNNVILKTKRGNEKMENQNQGKDKTLKCKDCGNDFILTAGEQEFYESKGFNEPQRCKECRNARKAQNNNR